jgi:hypothetical protein
MNAPAAVGRISGAAEQAKQFETTRKLNMVLEWLELQARMRAHASAYGRVLIEMVWEAGKIKRVKLNDEITIDDLDDKARELVMRATAGVNGKGRETENGKP